MKRLFPAAPGDVSGGSKDPPLEDGARGTGALPSAPRTCCPLPAPEQLRFMQGLAEEGQGKG